MSDNETYYSSPLHEPSQLDEEVRLKRVAELPPDQLAEYKALRRAKRIRHGQSPTSSPIPSPSSSPQAAKPHSKDDCSLIPRASATVSCGLIFNLFAPGGPLDSQTGSQDFVDGLCGYQGGENKSEESQLETGDDAASAPRIKQETTDAFPETQYSADDHEQRARTAALVHERDEALRERDEALQGARRERIQGHERLRDECARWYHERKQLIAELDIWRNAAQAAAQFSADPE